MDPDPDKFFCLLFLKKHLHHFSKIKSHKKITKQKESRFSYYFGLMIEGPGPFLRLTDPDPGGPKTYGSATLLLLYLLSIWDLNSYLVSVNLNPIFVDVLE
jgi:hypothetical protein